MDVVILGNGKWGEAVSSLFKENNVKFTFWTKGHGVPPDCIIFSAIPTQALREVLHQLKTSKNITFINGSKGIEQNTHLLPHQIVKSILPKADYLTLMGPSFANEVKEKMPTLVNLGYRNLVTAQKIRNQLQTDYFRIRLTKSVRAIELSAAFKNIYAIAAGIVDGLGYGTNTRVKLMLLAIDELKKLSKQLEFPIDANALPGTIGDLILTCSSNESRNYTFGAFLVKNSAEQSLKSVGETVEGYFTVKSVPYFEKKAALSLPLAHFVYEACYSESSESILQRLVALLKRT